MKNIWNLWEMAWDWLVEHPWVPIVGVVITMIGMLIAKAFRG